MSKIKQFNLNNNVVLYPSESGWKKILKDIKKTYVLSDKEAIAWVKQKTTKDGGYKEQLWVLMDVHHDMFFNGMTYLTSTNIDLIYED